MQSLHVVFFFVQSKLKAKLWGSFLTQGGCLFVILPCFNSTARGCFSTLSDKCSCRALKPVNVVVFPAFFPHAAHVSSPRASYLQRTFAPNFSLFNEAICSHIEQLYDYFRVKSKGSLQISTISFKFKVQYHSFSQ